MVALAAVYLAVNGVLLLPSLGADLSDFTAYYRAGSALLHGHSPFVVPNHDYPPLLSFLVAPLALLGYHQARAAWFILGHAAIALAAMWTARGLGGRLAQAVTVAFVWAAAGSVATTLREGQVNALLLVLVCAASWPPNGDCRRRAEAIGAAAALKVWPGIVVVTDVLARRTRNAFRAALTGTLLVALPTLAIAGLAGRPLWPPHTDYWMGTPAALNASLPAFALRVLDPPTKGAPLPAAWISGNDPSALSLPATHKSVSVAVAIAALISGLWLLRLATVGRRGFPDNAAVDAALLALALVASPIAWLHYQLLLLPGVAGLAYALAKARRRAELVFLAVAFLAANWTEPAARALYAAGFAARVDSVMLAWLVTSVPTAATAGIFVLHLRRLARPPAREGGFRTAAAGSEPA